MQRHSLKLCHCGSQLEDLAMRDPAIGLKHDFTLTVTYAFGNGLAHIVVGDRRAVSVPKKKLRFATRCCRLEQREERRRVFLDADPMPCRWNVDLLAPRHLNRE